MTSKKQSAIIKAQKQTLNDSRKAQRKEIKKMKVTSTLNAWKEAQKHIHNYEKDHEASKNAGYSIYRGDEGYIADLEARLEVNLDSGETFNIWIEEAKTEQTESNTASEGKYIIVDIKIDTDNGSRKTTTTDEAITYISNTTKLSDIGAFIANVEKMLRQAKKSAKNGSRATVTIYTNDGKHRNLWMARAEDINDDSIYFSPSSTNANPEHDFIITSITAINILRALEI